MGHVQLNGQVGQTTFVLVARYGEAQSHSLFAFQAPFVQKMDNAILRINLYPVDKIIGFPNIYPLDRAIEHFNN